MTLQEELRRRLSARSTKVGLHTAMLELREAMEDAIASMGGMDLRTHREDAIYDQGYEHGQNEGEELAKATYLDEAKEQREAANGLRASFADWGLPQGALHD